MFRVPRCLIIKDFVDGYSEKHCFSDASQRAYGVCTYLRTLNKYGDVKTSLIASKSRLCPKKVQTIPRLELQAALLSTTFEQSIRRALTFEISKSFFWTDSTIVLAYIKKW